jgi:hypothetical protein
LDRDEEALPHKGKKDKDKDSVEMTHGGFLRSVGEANKTSGSLENSLQGYFQDRNFFVVGRKKTSSASFACIEYVQKKP